MEAGTISKTCLVAIPGMTTTREDFDRQFIVMPFFLVAQLFLVIGLLADWMVERTELVPTMPTRELVAVVTTTTSTTKSTQFPTRYTYWTIEPRFASLAEREHG